MSHLLSKFSIPIPGRKPTASAKLAANNTWNEEPDFQTFITDSEDEDAGGKVAAPLNSANLRAHKGRPTTNDGQRLNRGLGNARDWITSSPLGASGQQGRMMLDDDSSLDESSQYAASSRLDPASSRPGVHFEQKAIQPYQPADEGTRKKSAKRRGESAGRKVTYNLTDDSESMDDLELLPQNSGLLHGIHNGPSYHDPLEREISKTLSAYNGNIKVSKSRSSSRGDQGYGGLDSERSVLTSIDSPQARSRALAEADNLMDMYAQPRPQAAREDYGDVEAIAPSLSKAAARPKSVLRAPSVPQNPPKLQYADGLGGVSGAFAKRAIQGKIVRGDISDSSEDEGDSSRRVRSRNGYDGGKDSSRLNGDKGRRNPNDRISTAQSLTHSEVSRSSRGAAIHGGWGATDTLARTLQTVNKSTRNPEYLPDLDDSDSDVLRLTDSDAEPSEQADTMRRLELTHAKTAPFTLGGTNDFDSFMKAVDKSVNKAVKVERRSQKSRAGSRPGSRAASLEETRRESQDEAREERKGGWERLPSRSGSRAEMSRQQAAGPSVVSTSNSKVSVQVRSDMSNADDPRTYAAPPRPDSKKELRAAPSVVKELGASVGLRRQHLAQIENGRVVPKSPRAPPGLTREGTARIQIYSPGMAVSPGTPMRRPMTTREDIVLAEQQEEMELLQQQQQEAIRKEREQQEILNRLKRDKTRKEVKLKDHQKELEELWEEQMKKDDLQYQQQKEIEFLRHQLAQRDQRERPQQEEIERLRRDVAERARADAEGAKAFDKLLAEKHKKLLFTPAEIRQQVNDKLQREQVQREQDEELRKMEDEACRMQAAARQAHAEAMLQARQEQISRDGSKHVVSGISNSDLLRHRNHACSYDDHSPSQLSRPATQLSVRRGSRPGTADTNCTVDSSSTSIREVREASEAAAQIRNGIKEGAARFKAQQIPGYTNGGYTRGATNGAVGGGSLATNDAQSEGEVRVGHKSKAAACKETPDISKVKHETVRKLNLDQIKSKHEKAPALKKYELEQQVRDHATELQRVSEDARNRAELAEAQRILEGPKSRTAHRAPKSTLGTARAISASISADTELQDELRKLEEEKAEFDRREKLHEEYIEQLKFEQEEKLEREATKRKALQELRGENTLIDRMLRETDQLEGGLVKEVGTLEALKEQFRRKQKLAEQLKEQQRELAEKQKDREQQLTSLKSEVSKASHAAGIQLMQMQRLKAIQEEAIFMQEQQQKELENLKAELQRKADLKGEQEEIARLRAEAKKLESEQSEQRATLRKEKELLEAAMQSQEDVEKEMQGIQREKAKREEAERFLRQTLAMETREMEKLSAESDKRRAEIDVLAAAKEAMQSEMEGGSAKEKLQQELEELRRQKQDLAENEARIARERRELEELNHRREEELQELEALRKRSEEIERAQARAKKVEEEALRIKEEKERIRMRAEEDRIRAALEYEAKKAQQEMEKERKKRQSEIDRLKKQIEQKKIGENAPIQEEEEEEEEEEPASKKVSDWLQSNDPDDVAEERSKAKKDKKKKKKSASAAGDITARSMNEEDDDGGTGNLTDRSDGSGKGPATQWRLARHGKIKELEAMLTSENVDDRDAKGNTCLHHACMQGKKRVAKVVLRLGADINAQNKRGHTCLHYCFAYGYEELGEYLISKGADESILNELGATCREVETSRPPSRAA